VDYIFVQNINIKKKYQEISKSKVITAGSFLSNSIKIKTRPKKIDVLYISTFRDIEKRI
jgi:surface carbohydrate biosynthesis protein